MNVIFQGEPWFLPGPGPLVAIPTNQILVDIAKKDGPLLADTFWAQYLTGGMGVTDDNMLEQAAPQWAKNIASAVRQDREEPRFSQAYVLEYQSLVNEVNRGERDPMSQTKLESMAANRTRNRFILQAMGSQAPYGFSTRPRSRMQFYVDEWRRYQRDHGIDAYDTLARDYPEYTEMAISLSVNETGIQATEEAWRAVQPYRKEIDRNPEYGWAFAGADNLLGEFSEGVYTAQRGQAIGASGVTFRSNKSAAEAIKDNALRRGWADYTKGQEYLRLELESRGLTSFQQKGAEDLAAQRSDRKSVV